MYEVEMTQMTTTTSTDTNQTIVEDTEAAYQQTLRSLANSLLDNFYGEVPQANAYGTSYDEPDHDDASWLLGRENGADGAADDAGIDYWYRKYIDSSEDDENRGRGRSRRASQEKDYLYGKYGWMDFAELVEETDRLRQLFSSAVEEGFLSEEDLKRFEEAASDAEAAFAAWRESFDLEGVAELFHECDRDTLFDLLATDDEEYTVVNALLNSYIDGEKTPNSVVETPLVSEEHAMMLVRAERVTDTNDGQKRYSYAAVVGYDDTPERFFVHRLNSDTDIKDPDTEWTVEMLKDKMGFDYHLWEVEGDKFPHNKTVRVQGDLTLTRRDYDAERWDYYESRVEAEKQQVTRDVAAEFCETHPEIDGHDDLRISPHSGLVRVYPDDTGELKSLQADLGIEEETIRDRMQDDWQQLTANRRQQLIEEVLADRIAQWGYANSDHSDERVRESAEQATAEVFDDMNKQVNTVAGNHTIIAGPAQEYPVRELDPDNDLWGAIVVADEATGIVVHDEHQDRALTLNAGIYEIGNLDGFETEFWMAQ